MIWLIFTLFAAALVAFLLGALRRYERESVTAVRREVEALREEMARIVERVQTLEAIAAAEPGDLEDPARREQAVRPRPDLSEAPTAFQDEPSVSSADPAPLPPRRTRQGPQRR